MKILLLDIETSPNLAYVWGLFKQNVSISQVAQAGTVLCWAAKWLGEDKMHFASIQRSTPKIMLEKVHRLVSEADAVVTYNGKRFDMPTLNREWILHGFQPPAPARQIDLYQTVKTQFRFASNKMDYVVQQLGLGGKVKHEGFDLWLKCMANNREGWASMREYNEQDVALLELLYHHVLPWIKHHPSHAALAQDVDACPKCGGHHMQQRGFAVTATHKYRRYQCKGCGSWFRGNRTILARYPERAIPVTT